MNKKGMFFRLIFIMGTFLVGQIGRVYNIYKERVYLFPVFGL